MSRLLIAILLALATITLSMSAGCFRVSERDDPQVEVGTENGGFRVN